MAQTNQYGFYLTFMRNQHVYSRKIGLPSHAIITAALCKCIYQQGGSSIYRIKKKMLHYQIK
jgi:hypothetical protein